MARPTPSRTPQTLTAAAAVLPSVKHKAPASSKSTTAAAWQAEAWGFYDTVGELRYAANWFSNALSRARLYTARRNPDGTLKEVTEGPEHEIITSIFGADSSEMLKEIGKHWFIPGEWYLVGRKDDRGKEVWEVYSSQEVKYVNKSWEIKPGGSRTKTIKIKDSEFIERMWKPHPTAHHEPDSPVKAILPSLREISALTSHISAQTSSRLYTGELALFPSEVELPAPPGTNQELNSAESLMALMQEQMRTSVQNPGSPESLAPIVITMPGEYIEKVNKISFWTKLDENAADMREKAISRMALGLDMPPEVLTGTAGLNHWSSWQMEESSIKAHIEPALDTIVSALTETLLDNKDPDIVVAYDTSKLRMRPNRSKEAIELWQNGAISLKALLRETGFPDDEPSKEDIKLFLLLKIAGGSATPQMVVDAARALGVTELTGTGEEGDMRESRPAPSLREHPVRELPDLDMGALRVVMMRAMERAGNRLKNKMRGTQMEAVAACDLYLHLQPSSDQFEYLLEDAFSFLPKVVPADLVAPVETALTRYAHTLLQGQHPITDEGLRAHLEATMAPRTHEEL